MKNILPQCNDRQLQTLLDADEQTTEFRAAADHLESCESCQSRLTELAAEAADWADARQSLTPSEADLLIDREQEGRSWNGAGQGHALTTWTDSMAKQLLSPPSHPEMLGRLGRYEIERLIGSGGMGIVFKAFDSELNRPVAIKVLAPHLAGSGAARKRFAREARAAAAVVHEHVVAIHNVESKGEPPFLVMHYVAGESLQTRLDREGPLSVCEVLRIAYQTAAGLSAAHKQGLVHRDVKPSNIMLEQGVERALLTDFGLARASDDASLTHSGHALGTPHYMSPEQARGERVEQRSDLFSLGSVMYAMSTGRMPFRAETSYGVLRRITDTEPRAIQEVNPEIPQWLCHLIGKLMSKQADDRFDSAQQVAELLEECLAHVQQPDTVPLPATLVTRPKRSRFFSGSRRKTGVIAMLALGLGLLGMFFMQMTAPPDIADKWTGDDWGQVVLEKRNPGKYEGTYSDTVNERSGTIRLKWSRSEGRFNGTWKDGKDGQGKISLRRVGDEIRGAWTTRKKSGGNSGTPKLADLVWSRSKKVASANASHEHSVRSSRSTHGDYRADMESLNEQLKVARFSETKELTLAMGSMTFMLDLDTNQTMDNPARSGRPLEAQMDVHPTQWQPYQYPSGLSGRSLHGLKVNSNNWNVTAPVLRNALASRSLRLMTQMDYDSAEPATYFFRTRTGAGGILQLLALTEEPKGIRIRYKALDIETVHEEYPAPTTDWTAAETEIRQIEQQIDEFTLRIERMWDDMPTATPSETTAESELITEPVTKEPRR